MFGADYEKCYFCVSCFRNGPRLQEHPVFTNIQLCNDCAMEYVEKLSVFERGANVSRLTTLKLSEDFIFFTITNQLPISNMPFQVVSYCK